jgi:predicted methyltransferase
MRNSTAVASALIVGLIAVAATAQGPSPKQVAQERAQAEREVPMLTKILRLEPGMAVADVGAGRGAMTVVLGKWLGPSGRVFATDIGATQLATIRDYAKREQLDNVTVFEGAEASTNLPTACCDAVFMRDVYHHLTRPMEFNKSLAAALRAGGYLAVIDFVPDPGSKLFPGVNPNRGGHGISPALVISEVSEAGLTYQRTVDPWPDQETGLFLVLFRKSPSPDPEIRELKPAARMSQTP